MNVILLGGSGAPNYGDELILRDWISYITSNHPLYSLHVQGISHQGIQKSVDAASCSAEGSVTTSSVLLDYASLKPKLSFFEQVLRGKRFIEHGVFRENSKMTPFVKHFETCDIFHLHGGGYMNDMWPGFGFIFGVGVALKEMFKTKFVCTGLGVTPLTVTTDQERHILKMILEATSLFGIRDPFGVAFLAKETGIAPFLDIDDAFLQPVKIKNYLPRKSILHISTYDWILKIDESIIEFLKLEAKKYDEICLWECSPAADWKAIQAIKDLGFKTTVIGVEELLDEGLPFAKTHALFTNRYHPAVQIYRIGGTVTPSFSGDYYTHKHQATHALGALNESSHGSFLAARNKSLIQLKNDQADWIYAE